MALPAVAAIAARKYAQQELAKKMGGAATSAKPKPSIMSPGGMIMMFVAGVSDLLCMLPIIGTVAALIVSPIATTLIGGWIYFATGSFPFKKSLTSSLIKAVPFAQFYPKWTMLVWNTCDHSI